MEAKQFTLKAKTPKNQAMLNRTIKALVKYNNLNNQRDKADDSGDEKLYRKLNRQCEVAFDKYLELAEELPKYEKDRLENSDVYLHYAKGGMMDNGNTKNGKYLDNLSSDKKSRILKNIASHYRISVADAEDEVRDEDAEMLYEYIANDKSLQMEIYNDMERGKMAKGGITEHGLEIGDKITGRGHGDKIEGYNKEMRETFTTDLDKGKRNTSKYAKGGKTKQDPPIVRSYFEDEAIDYGQGGLMTGWCYSIGGL